MRLRLRSLETKQTHKIQISDSSSLEDLKLALLQSLSPNQNPSIQNLHFSLNRKDEFHSSTQTLLSLGITNGDLIFFTLSPLGFNSCFQEFTATNLETQTPSETEKLSTFIPESSSSSVIKDTQEEKFEEVGQEDYFMEVGFNSSSQEFSTPNLETQAPSVTEKLSTFIPESSSSSVNKDTQEEKFEEMGQEDDFMEVGDDSVEADVGKSFSVPGFLRKVFTEELGDDGGRDHKLLVIAIHAILLDSGFVAYDAVARKEINGFPFRNQWPLGLFNLRLFYTLPEILNSASNRGDPIDSVVLKFHSLGDSVTVYGSLVNASKSQVYRVSFEEDKLVPFLNVVWANCGLKEEVGFDGQGSGTNAEKEVFEFWRRVKDVLALPMLIDLGEKSGFGLPPCFMRLPTEIKLQILESLPGVDVARVGCACSELRYLSSSNELWKKKYAEEFGDAAKDGDEGHWKRKFVRSWETYHRRRRVVGRYSVGRNVPRMPYIIGGVHDILPHVQIIGGDYDRLPQPFGPLGLPLGGVPPFRRHRQSSQVPPCNLGGSGSNPFT